MNNDPAGESIREVPSGSSLFATEGFLVIGLLAAVLCVVFHKNRLGAAFGAAFLLGLLARLWAQSVMKKLSLRISYGARGVFPGERLNLELISDNSGFLPALHQELYLPLGRSCPLVPEHTRETEPGESVALEHAGAFPERVGEEKLPPLLWYGEARHELSFTAEHRGLWNSAGWRLRSGDGFGLCQVEKGLDEENRTLLAVFPALQPVTAEPLLKNLWSAAAGMNGMEEDVTLIRSTRDYRDGDPARAINWRQLARGQALTVNVYDEILPRSLYFILDGESFGSKNEPHREELEDCLSLLASEIMLCKRKKVLCSLLLSKDISGKTVNISYEAGVEEQMTALAAYEPQKPPTEEEGGTARRNPPDFRWGSVLDSLAAAGRIFYCVYDAERLKQYPPHPALAEAPLTVLAYSTGGAPEGMEVLGFDSLKKAV